MANESFTLRLIFEGICALVPDSPFFVYEEDQFLPGTPSSVTVLLPDLRSPKLADWEDANPQVPVAEPFYRPSHAPVLILSPHDLVKQTPDFRVDAKFYDPVSSRLRLLHVLDNEIVSLDGLEWPPLTFEHQIPDPVTSKLPDKGGDDRSLWWVPRMSDISPMHQWCRKELVSLGRDDLAANQIAARLVVGGGHLSIAAFNSKGEAFWKVGSVSRDANGNLLQAESGWQRAIGNVLACEIQVPTPELDVSFDESDEGATITLGPRKPGGTVEVTIANAELENIIMPAASTAPPWVKPFLPDTDFQGYYPLTTGAQTKPWPVPLESSEAGTQYKPCPITAFTGVSQARRKS